MTSDVAVCNSAILELNNDTLLYTKSVITCLSTHHFARITIPGAFSLSISGVEPFSHCAVGQLEYVCQTDFVHTCQTSKAYAALCVCRCRFSFHYLGLLRPWGAPGGRGAEGRLLRLRRGSLMEVQLQGEYSWGDRLDLAKTDWLCKMYSCRLKRCSYHCVV